jgi:GNAT superfamily N-acetyltransferase
MLQFRSFRNTDPPVLASIWRSRRGQPGLLQPVSADMLEQLVLGKPYFDHEGLILACQDGQCVGFAHAGFGPNEAEDRISTELGVTCVVMVRPDCPDPEVAAGLLQRCEAYLRRRGAKVLYGGGIRPLNPFYLGLYGGSELPGVLDTDSVACRLFRGHGYREIDRTCIYHHDVGTFQAPISRQHVQLRRSTVVEVTVDPPARTWWEACTMGDFDLTQFQLVPRGGGPPLARALLRNLEPTGVCSPTRAAGLIELEVAGEYRRQGLSTFLLVEVFRQLARQGVATLEVQTMQHNRAAVALYRKLGFRQVDQGIVFRKEGTGAAA